MIVARSVRYEVAGRAIVRDVSLEVRPGELVGVVGPNGAGKSTLLHLLAGVLRPSAGEVAIAGRPRDTGSRAEAARRCATLLQDDALMAPLLAREVVALGRHPHGDAERYDVVAALDRVGLGAMADRRVDTMSGGERQRVHLARVFAQLDSAEGRVLLLDEPTSALDLAQQQSVLGMVTSIAEERSIAVLVVLHDLNLAGRFADRLVLLRDGAIVGQGPTADVLTADQLGATYGVAVHVLAHPDDGRPQVLVAREHPPPVADRLRMVPEVP